MAFGTSIIRLFRSQFSQSILYGRNGSNACTFIALQLPKFYFLHKYALSLSQYMSLLLNWINLFINCIPLGNLIYDSVTTGVGGYFSVQEATPFLGLITSNVQLVEESFDLSILNENPASKFSGILFRTALQRRQPCCCCNHEWYDQQPGWTKQQHYSHSRPLALTIWCHGWHNQC